MPKALTNTSSIPDISNAIALHRISGAMATIVLKYVLGDQVASCGVVEIDEDR
tara:strand:+ start:6176 stop:6334 length:159 start_codon:yes stop_codon:yes gene_type:complete